MTTTEWWVVAMTVINVATFIVYMVHSRSTGYYTAWSQVFAAMRMHAQAAPKGDLDAISRMYAALAAEFDRQNKEGKKP